MTIDRTAWTDAYQFNAEAVERLEQMEPEVFWKWMAAKVLKIANTHNNDPLTMGLLIAVFEAMEAASKERRNDIITEGA